MSISGKGTSMSIWPLTNVSTGEPSIDRFRTMDCCGTSPPTVYVPSPTTGRVLPPKSVNVQSMSVTSKMLNPRGAGKISVRN